MARLRRLWSGQLAPVEDLVETLLRPEAQELDRFDRTQLADLLQVCRESRSLSEAGRHLFSESRKRWQSTNDADRLRKYLARFGLSWRTLAELPQAWTSLST